MLYKMDMISILEFITAISFDNDWIQCPQKNNNTYAHYQDMIASGIC